MFWKKGKPSTKAESSPVSQNPEDLSLRRNESHQMTLNRPFGLEEAAESFSTSIEYHLTIQIQNQSLTRKELSLLLDVLNYQAVHFGLNLTMVLAMYELYFRLLGQKTKSTELREQRIRLTVTVSELILKSLKNVDWSLWSGESIVLNPKLVKILEKGLMSKRTYGSRFRTYRPEKFLRVRIVPVDIQFLKRRKDTQPYSSYCKGYGESHPSAHRSKLKPSAEYDGTGESPAEVEEKHLFDRCTDPIHVLSEYLLIRYNNEMDEEN